MASEVVGISLPVDVKEALDRLAAELETSRSGAVAQLVRERMQRSNGHPDVRVDGVRWQPAEKKNPWAPFRLTRISGSHSLAWRTGSRRTIRAG